MARARGEGSYRTRRDGRVEWRGWIETPAGRVRKSVFGSNRREVAARVLELRGQVARSELASSDRATVRSFLEDWLARCPARGVRESSMRIYERIVKGTLVKRLGHHRLAKLRRVHVVVLVEQLAAEGLKPRSVSLVLDVLRAALHDAVSRELVAVNVASRVPVPRAASAEPEPLTAAQVQALLEAARKDRAGSLVIVAMTTGLRQGELLGLRWQDVDLEARRLSVRHTLVKLNGKPWHLGPPKSERGVRTISLPQVTAEALRSQSKAQKEARLRAGPAWQELDFVFSRPDGTPWSAAHARGAYDRILAAAGIGHRRFHSTRHDAVGLLLAAGAPLKLVSEVIGHASIAITADVYGRLAEAAKDQAAAAMDRALGGQNGGQGSGSPS